MVTPVIGVALKMVPKDLEREWRNKWSEEESRTLLLKVARILRRVLETLIDLLSLRL